MPSKIKKKRREKRKHREGEVNCRCGAYKFVHRLLGGYCVGVAYVADFFALQAYGECRSCPLLERSEEGWLCRVLDGGEPARECEALQDYIRFEGIKLYGMNQPPKKTKGLTIFVGVSR